MHWAEPSIRSVESPIHWARLAYTTEVPSVYLAESPIRWTELPIHEAGLPLP